LDKRGTYNKNGIKSSTLDKWLGWMEVVGELVIFAGVVVYLS
jgi:hypothetical protein